MPERNSMIVWGASGGVGKEIVKRLALSGRYVLAYVRDPAAAKEAEGLHERITARVFSIDEAFYVEEAAYLRERDYRIAGMVDCVGSTTSSPDASLTQRLDDFMRPNLYHQYFATLTFKDSLQPGASVVLVSSIRALTGTNNANIEYAFAKAGIENLTKSLAYMYAERQVRVNCIRPTPILDTKMSASWPQSLVDELTNQSVFKELLSPADIADVVEFLMSDRAKSLTGAVIDVNNGFATLR